ncbi:MAG: hypothetical protein ACTSW1_02210 [Candidatus Hodarchaeales archaeon]
MKRSGNNGLINNQVARNFGIIMLVILMTSSPLVQIFSTPIFTPIVVNMDPHSREVNSTVQEIQNEISAEIINFGSLRYFFAAIKARGILIYVGHGNTEGIISDNRVISYKDLVTKNFAPFIIFAACHSSVASKIDTRKTVLGFQGEIDNIIAANCINVLIGNNLPQYAKDRNTVVRSSRNIVNRLQSLENGAKTSTLSCASSEEYTWFGLSLLFTVLAQVLLIWGISWILSKGASIASKFINAVKSRIGSYFQVGAEGAGRLGSMISSLKNAGLAIGSITVTIPDLFKILVTCATKFIESAINTLNWWDWIIISASFVASIYAIFQTSGTSLGVGLVIAAWPVYKVLMNGYYNIMDNDGTWNEYYTAWWKVLMLF